MILAMICGVFAIAWGYGSYSAKSPTSTTRTIEGVTQDQRDAAHAFIKLAGYRCDSISYMGNLIFKSGFQVTCNDSRYAYEIVDEGGRWVVRLD